MTYPVLIAVLAAIVGFALIGASATLVVSDRQGKTQDRVNEAAISGERAVCAIERYAEAQATNLRAAARGGPVMTRGELQRRADELETLAGDMRHTGIRCPPKR